VEPQPVSAFKLKQQLLQAVGAESWRGVVAGLITHFTLL